MTHYSTTVKCAIVIEVLQYFYFLCNRESAGGMSVFTCSKQMRVVANGNSRKFENLILTKTNCCYHRNKNNNFVSKLLAKTRKIYDFLLKKKNQVHFLRESAV